METIKLSNAVIQHKRGNELFWSQTTAPVLQKGELGFLLSETDQVISVRVGDGITGFLDLPDLSSVEALEKLNEVSNNYIAAIEYDAENNKIIISPIIDGDFADPIEVVMSGGSGGGGGSEDNPLSTVTREFRFSADENDFSETVLSPVRKGDKEKAFLNFECASFGLNADSQIVRVYGGTKYTLYKKANDGSWSLLKSAAVLPGLKPVSLTDPVDDTDETTMYPNLGPGVEYKYQYRIDVTNYLVGAEVNAPVAFRVVLQDSAKNNSEEMSTGTYPLDFSFRIRQPEITNVTSSWWKPLSLSEGKAALPINYDFSGTYGAGTCKLYYKVGTADAESVDITNRPSHNLTIEVHTSGKHTVFAWIECTLADGSIIESETVSVSFLVADPVSIMIYTPFNQTEFDEGDRIVVPFALSFNNDINSCKVKCTMIYDAGMGDQEYGLPKVLELSKGQKLDNAPQFLYNDYPVDTNFKIQLEVEGTHVKWVSDPITVKSGPYSKLIIPTSGYDYNFTVDTVDKDNNQWRSDSASLKSNRGDLSGFNWVSNGLVGNDGEGRTAMKFSGDAKATFDTKLFYNASKEGYSRSFEIDLKVSSAGDPATKIVRCYHDANKFGFFITPASITIQGNSVSLTRKFGSSSRIRLGFVIEPPTQGTSNPFVYIYINGVMSGVVDYTVADFNFHQYSGLKLEIGGEYIESGSTVVNDAIFYVYNIRQYSQALGPANMLQNHIHGIPDRGIKTSEYDANNILDDNGNIKYSEVKKQLPVVTIIGMLPTFKGCKRTALLHIEYPNGRQEVVCTKAGGLDVQGTSSAGYARKNWKIKIPKNLELIEGQMASNVYCIKVDFAEGTGSHNTQNAHIVERLYDLIDNRQSAVIPVKRDTINNRKIPVKVKVGSDTVDAFWEPSDDVKTTISKVRTTIAGQPIVLYHYQPSDVVMKSIYGGSLPEVDKQTGLLGAENDEMSDLAYAFFSSKDGTDLLKNIKDSERKFYSKGNLNFDKGAENVFAFKTPYSEELSIEDSRISFQDPSVKADNAGATIKVKINMEDVECWEFRDNIDECRFRVHPDDLNFFEAFEGRFHPDWDTYEELADMKEDERRATIDPDTGETLQKKFEDLRDKSTGMPKRLMDLYRWVYSTARGTYKGPDGSDRSYATGETLPEPYVDIDGNTYTEDTDDYRLSKFKTECATYFNLNSLLIYYVYTHVAQMVDQRAKNLFLTFWKDDPTQPYDEENNPGKWYPYFYDNDTSYGIDNTGRLELEYYYEDYCDHDTALYPDNSSYINSQGELTYVYAGKSSVLWQNVHDAFATSIKDTYTTLRLVINGISYNTIYGQVIENGAKKYTETIYNTDATNKYIESYKEFVETGNSAVNTIHNVKGPEDTYLDYYLMNRLLFCDGKWGDPADETPGFQKDICPEFRVGKRDPQAEPGTIEVVLSKTAYIPQMRSDNSEDKGRWSPPTYGTKGSVVTIELLPAGAGSNGNERRYFPLAEQISAIQNPSEVQITEMMRMSAFKNLEEINLVGASCGKLDLEGQLPLLRVVNLANSTVTGNDKHTVDLKGCPSVQYFNAEGNNFIEAVEFSDESDSLRVVKYPNTLKTISLKNQHHLEEINIVWNNVTDILIDNCTLNGTDASIEILNDALYTGRHFNSIAVSGCRWSFNEAYEAYEFIRSLRRISDTVVIGGRCHINELTIDDQLAEYETTGKSLIDLLSETGLTVTYGSMEVQVAFGSTGHIVTTVFNDSGDTHGDISKTGKVELAGHQTFVQPHLEKTDHHTFTFIGWEKVDPSAENKWTVIEDIPDNAERLSSYDQRAAFVNKSCTVYPVFKATINRYKVSFVVDQTSTPIWESPNPGYSYGTQLTPEKLIEDGARFEWDGTNIKLLDRTVTVDEAITTFQLPEAWPFWSSMTIEKDLVYRIPGTLQRPNIEPALQSLFIIEPVGNPATHAIIKSLRPEQDWSQAVDSKTGCVAFPTHYTFRVTPESPEQTVPITQIEQAGYNFGQVRVTLAGLNDSDFSTITSPFILNHGINNDGTRYLFHYQTPAVITGDNVNNCLSYGNYQPLFSKKITVCQSGNTKLHIGSDTMTDLNGYQVYVRLYDNSGALLKEGIGSTVKRAISSCVLDCKYGDELTVELGLYSTSGYWYESVFLMIPHDTIGLHTDPLVIKGIVIPPTVTNIVPTAFSQYTSLSDVWHDTDSEVTLNSKALSDCSSLRFCEWFCRKTSNKLILNGNGGDGPFSYCGLKHLTITRPVSLGHGGFMHCKQLQTVTFTDDSQIYWISGYSKCHNFQYCTALERVRWRCSETGSITFFGCSKLKTFEVSLPGSTSTFTVGPSAFSNCSELEVIDAPPNVHIYLDEGGSHHFSYNYRLSDETLQRVIKDADILPSRCFQRCQRLKSFVGREDLTIIGPNAFEGCTALNTVDLRKCDYLEQIDESAFLNCKSIEHLLFPPGDVNKCTLRIGTSAFFDALLNGVEHQITLPGNVTYIGVDAIGSTSTPSTHITITLNEWWKILYLFQEGAPTGTCQIDMPRDGRATPFRFGNNNFGTLMGAPLHSKADPAVDIRGTTSYNWGMREVYYTDENGKSSTEPVIFDRVN